MGKTIWAGGTRRRRMVNRFQILIRTSAALAEIHKPMGIKLKKNKAKIIIAAKKTRVINSISSPPFSIQQRTCACFTFIIPLPSPFLTILPFPYLPYIPFIPYHSP
jgi:hypothetical protein